jgi:hypothetical protein
VSKSRPGQDEANVCEDARPHGCACRSTFRIPEYGVYAVVVQFEIHPLRQTCRKMDMIDTAWRSLNPISAKGALNHVPRQPGLYKLTFKLWGTTYVYIGEGGNLWNRMRDYAHNPTQGNKMEHLLFDLLTEAGEAELSICCLGLKSKDDRCIFETSAVTQARGQGLKCLNRGAPTDIRMRRFRLESEERMLIKDLERVRAELAKL